jgi:3-methylfumaryl-CoA hydratase
MSSACRGRTDFPGLLVSEAERPFAEWIGRTSESEDVVTDRLAMSFRAIFEPFLAPVAPGEAPIGIHWCLSPATEPMAALGRDGHPARNLHLPPVPLPRRMWAGGSVECIGRLHVGDRVHRRSTISGITRKVGRSGELWFVAVDHQYGTDRGIAIRERHDIVYRAAPGPSDADTSASARSKRVGEERAARLVWTVETTPTLLFRYSALTFNGHRIHYDLPYATNVEGYDGLVVHGPLQATLLLNLAALDGAPPPRFVYRGIAPAIAGTPLLACAGEGDGKLWTAGRDGTVHMEAEAG